MLFHVKVHPKAVKLQRQSNDLQSLEQLIPGKEQRREIGKKRMDYTVLVIILAARALL